MRFFPVEHTDWSLRRKIKVGPNSNADDPRLRVGCSESKQSARLCAIDLFLTVISEAVPQLMRIPRSGYGRPCPPLLLVESSSESSDYVGVYIDFLMSHTNLKTRDVYAQGLKRFFEWIAGQNTGTRLQEVAALTGSYMSLLRALALHFMVEEPFLILKDKKETWHVKELMTLSC